MSVVAAAVHDALVVRAEAEAVLLGVFHAVHVGAESYRVLCALGAEDGLEAGLRQHPQLVRAAGLKDGLYVLVRLAELKAELRYPVQIPAYLHAVVLHAEYLFAYLHFYFSVAISIL